MRLDLSRALRVSGVCMVAAKMSCLLNVGGTVVWLVLPLE